MNNVDILSIHDIIVKDIQNSHSDEEKRKNKWKKLYQEINENSSNDVLKDLESKFNLKDEFLN